MVFPLALMEATWTISEVVVMVSVWDARYETWLTPAVHVQTPSVNLSSGQRGKVEGEEGMEERKRTHLGLRDADPWGCIPQRRS